MNIKPPSSQAGRMHWAILVGVLVVVVLAVLTATVLMNNEGGESLESTLDARAAALASPDAPTLGNPDAPVHIVEFIDPACETCALFYPMVKKWLEEAPDQLRLSIRHVPFHRGADYAVKVLEASREQGKYWETLEAMLATQSQWTQHHTVVPEKIAPAIASVGLDMVRLKADMESNDVKDRMDQDQQDAVVLKVSATPEYFVNGRPLPSFGRQQLLDLVREEIAKAGQPR